MARHVNRHYNDGGRPLCSGGRQARFPRMTTRKERVSCGACKSILDRWEPQPPEAA